MALVVAVVLGLILRVWGLGFGLPFIYHYDEHLIVNAALNLGRGVISNPLIMPGLSNVLFLEYALYYVSRLLSGVVTSPAEFAALYRADPSVFYLLGRITVAVLSTLSIPLVWNLGRQCYGKTVGNLAAIVLAVSFLHVRDSHYSVPDTVMPVFLLIALILALRGCASCRVRDVALAAFAGGAATAMKWSAIAVFVPISVAMMEVSKRTWAKMAVPKGVFLACLCLFAGFFVVTPQVILSPRMYIDAGIAQARADQAGGYDQWRIDSVSGWGFYLKTLYRGLGLPLLLACTVGAGITAYTYVTDRDRRTSLLVLFGFPLAYYLAMGSSRRYFARYALPLIPFAALLAAVAIEALSSRLLGGRIRRPLLFVITVCCLAIPFVASVRHDALLTRIDTRTLAKQWVEANLPQGASIAVDWPTHGPPLATQSVSVPSSTRFYRVEAIGGTGLADHSIAWYRSQGYEYLIASSFIYNLDTVSTEANPERRAFYDRLDTDLDRVQAFWPGEAGVEPPFVFDEIYGPFISLWQRERPGPVLKIYRLE